MGQPLLQKARRAPWQGEALGSGAALDVGQQDRRVPGPVDVIGEQVIDAVGDDPGVDAEKQPVGDHHVRDREQIPARIQEPAAVAHHMLRAAQLLPEAGGGERTDADQQPPQIVRAPPALVRVPSAFGRGQCLLVPGERLVSDGPAGSCQPSPLGLAVGRELTVIALRVVRPARSELQDLRVELAAGRAETLQVQASRGPVAAIQYCANKGRRRSGARPVKPRPASLRAMSRMDWT